MRFFLSLAFVLSATSVVAAISPEEMRALAYANDIDAAEAAMAEAHAESLTGETSFEDLRALVDILRTTHPDVVDFVGAWRVAYPDSAYPKAIQAFQLNDLSWHYRGQEFADKTHPDAIWAFRKMQDEAAILASEAFEISADFLPASDAVLTMQLATRHLRPARFEGVQRMVMSRQPNTHTLYLAARTAMPQWGGGGNRAIRQLCGFYAVLVPDPEYSTDVCAAEMIAAFGDDQKAGEFLDTVISASDHPNLWEARIRRAMHHRTPADRAFLMDHLAQPGSTTGFLPHFFRYWFDQDADSLQLLEDVNRRMQAEARAALRHDPFNGEQLTVALGDYVPFAQSHNGLWKDSDILRRRMVLARPFDAATWTNATTGMPEVYEAATIRDQDAYFINAIYYSDHGMSEVLALYGRKYRMYYRYHDANVRYQITPDYLSEEEEIELLLCPIARLSRMVRVHCETFEGSTPVLMCDPTHGAAPKAAFILADRGAEALCPDEMAAPLVELGYLPLPVDLGPLMQGAANRAPAVQ